MKRSGIRIGFGIALWLGIPLGLGAKTYTFHFPPPGHKEACDKYLDLQEKGLNVKADRHIKQYHAKHLPMFTTWEDDYHGKVTAKMPRTYRLTVPGGWKPYSEGFRGEIPMGLNTSGNPIYHTAHVSKVEIPKQMLEKWEDILYKHFRQSENWVFSEITVREESAGNSQIIFCSSQSSTESIWLRSDGLVLISYKLQRVSKAKNPNSDDALVADAESASDEKSEAEETRATSISPLLFFDSEGDPAPFNKLLQNGPVVLNFTASYCTACEEELKLLKELHAKRKKPDAQLVVVDIDKKENQELYMNKFRALMGNKPPARTQLLFDPYQKNYQKVNGDGEEKLPLTLLVDQNGKILRRITGFDRAGLEQLYKKLETLR